MASKYRYRKATEEYLKNMKPEDVRGRRIDSHNVNGRTLQKTSEGRKNNPPFTPRKILN